MSERPPEGTHVEGGIFTPWDKILERIERQYDNLLAKMDAKVDAATFSQFVGTYEQRHIQLQDQLSTFIKEARARWEAQEKDVAHRRVEVDKELRVLGDARERYVPILENAISRIESLEDDRLSRDAVKKDRQILYYGGGVLSLLVLVNLIVNIVQGARVP